MPSAAKLAILVFASVATILPLQHLNFGKPYNSRDYSAPAPQSSITDVIISRAVSIFRRQDNAPSAQNYRAEQAMSFSQLINRWQPLVQEASARFKMPAEWIRAVMRTESGGRTMSSETQKITSKVGAMGLMQVMPSTYNDMRRQYKLGADPYNPHDNVIAGAAYLSWLHQRYGYPAMFAAYNDGPGNLEAHLHHGRSLPQETRNYLVRVAGAFGLNAGVVKGGPHGKTTKLTRPNGDKIAVEIASVKSVRAPLPGEYPRRVHAVISMQGWTQAVTEKVSTVKAAIRG
jgi:membrane-bound lytic murein transglycosylase B